MFSKKQQIYFLREKNKKLYSIPRDIIETVLFLEVLSLVEEWISKYIKTQKEFYKNNSKKLLEDLNCQYLQLLDLRFENKIDEFTFQKKQKSLLGSIRNIDESIKDEVDFGKIENLISRLKRIKKHKTQVIKTVIKVCYVIEKETDNLILKIVLN